MDFTNLINRCHHGERAAQKALFDHFAGKMLYVCHRYAIDTDEANDMLQEGFIRLFNNLDKYENKGPFEGWVRKIFVNTAIKYYHKMRKHHLVADADTATGLENDQADALSLLSERELLDLLLELPDGYRLIFNMYVIEGFSHAEIASALQIQESTSRSQLVKARKLLQSKVIDLQKIAI